MQHVYIVNKKIIGIGFLLVLTVHNNYANRSNVSIVTRHDATSYESFVNVIVETGHGTGIEPGGTW